MKRKMLAVFAPLALFAAFFVVPAMASATTLHEGSLEGPPLPLVGEEGEQEVLTRSSNLTFLANSGVRLECNENELGGGMVTANGGPSVTLTVTRARFQGNGGLCATNVGAPALITTNVVPGDWIVHLFEDGTYTLTGPIVFTAQLFVSETESVECTYEAASVSGTYNPNEFPLELNVAGQVFTKTAGPLECGTAGELNGEFTESETEESHEPVGVSIP